MRRRDFISYCRCREHIDGAAAEDCFASGDLFAAGWFAASASRFRREADAAANDEQAAMLASYPADHPGWDRLLNDVIASPVTPEQDPERWDGMS